MTLLLSSNFSVGFATMDCDILLDHVSLTKEHNSIVFWFLFAWSHPKNTVGCLYFDSLAVEANDAILLSLLFNSSMQLMGVFIIRVRVRHNLYVDDIHFCFSELGVL